MRYASEDNVYNACQRARSAALSTSVKRPNCRVISVFSRQATFASRTQEGRNKPLADQSRSE